MKIVCLLLFVVFCMTFHPQTGAQTRSASKRSARPTPGAARKGPIGAGRAGNGPVSQHWKISPDLNAQVAKYKTVRMPFNAAGLTARERQMINKLVQASQYLEYIYWRQSDPEAITLYQQLTGSRYPQDEKLRRLLFINAGRFDQLENNQPFIGTEPMPPGRGFFPPGLTREQIEHYVKAHPEQREAIYNGWTLVRRRNGSDELETVPYHVAYRAFLEPAARLLREAAALSADAAFARFLRMRADALLTDDYYQSDLAWLDLKDPKFDVIFAPYETYLDNLLGVKTSYGAAVLIRNEAESRKLAVFQKYVPDIQDALPLPPEDRPSKKGHENPMEVMDAPYRTADLDHGYQAVADNLPNDPRIHQQKGTKKIFFKNFMDARVNQIILPLARRMMRPDQASLATAHGYLSHTMMHEISHGLGPAFARVNGKQVDIREAIGPIYSALEEAKADVVGMFGLLWLMDHGYLPAGSRDEFFASYLAGNFRTVRFGVAEAHGRAEMMEFNYLSEQKVFTRDNQGRYGFDPSRMPAAITALAKELLEIEASGDRTRAESWFAKYDRMPPELAAELKKHSDIPVDISPIFSWPIKVE
jgi:hypothetical protein